MRVVLVQAWPRIARAVSKSSGWSEAAQYLGRPQQCTSPTGKDAFLNCRAGCVHSVASGNLRPPFEFSSSLWGLPATASAWT